MPKHTPHRSPPAAGSRSPGCALAHTSRSAPLAGTVLLLVLTSLAGCKPSPAPSPAANTAQAERTAKLDRLVELFTPLAETVTSNITDQRFIDGQALLAELSGPDPALGQLALARLRQDSGPKLPKDVERALITVAARADREGTRTLLENLVTQYGAELSLRTEAVLLFAEVHPDRAVEVLEPYVRKGRQESTLPPAEFLVRSWIIACDKLGKDPVPVLADVATNLYMDSSARVMAVKALGLHPESRLSQQAISAILIESTGDGYLRRMAVQSLLKLVPRESACQILTQVADREGDTNMLFFLKDVLDKNCSR